MVDAESFVEDAVEEIRGEVEGDALIALSGGVDSSVCAELAHLALGDDLHLVFIDTGLMRKGEVRRIEEIFDGKGLRVVDASDRFLEALEGVTDPEEKRKAVGEIFIREFERVAEEEQVDYLIQGTIYPDRIESEGGIKSHHNVGGLPSVVDFDGVVEPIRELYKDEVRVVARHLGLPEEIAERMPFPGPGLAVRVVGEVTEEKLRVAREANAIVEDELLKYRPWQTFAAVLGKATGVKGDQRVYGWVVAVRAVESRDGMTARAMEVPWDHLKEAGGRIVGEIPEVSRAVYDVTDKPPATIEFE